MKRNKNVEMLLIGFLVIQTIAAIVLYPKLPARIPTHWDMDGQVNGWTGRLWGILLPLLISFGVYFLYLCIPLLDPKRKISTDQKGYTAFRVGTQVLTFAIFSFVMTNALGIPLSMDRLVPAAVSLLLVVFGIYMGKIQPNYFIGIRTPWTLENSEVWRKTHKLGGPVYIAIGLISLLGSFFGKKIGFLMLIVPVIGGSLFIVFYSWWIYRNLNGGRQEN